MIAAIGYLLLLLAVVIAGGGVIWGIVAWDAARRRREQAQWQAARAWWTWQAAQRAAAEAHAAAVRWQQELAARQTLGGLLAMAHDDFELFVARLLVDSGYRDVKHSGKTGDQGVDVHAITPDGHYVIVQCKHYVPGNTIGGPVVQQFLGALVQHGAHLGMFVTTSDFTPQAQTVAQGRPLRLINGDELVNWVQSVRARQVAPVAASVPPPPPLSPSVPPRPAPGVPPT